VINNVYVYIYIYNLQDLYFINILDQQKAKGIQKLFMLKCLAIFKASGEFIFTCVFKFVTIIIGGIYSYSPELTKHLEIIVIAFVVLNLALHKKLKYLKILFFNYHNCNKHCMPFVVIWKIKNVYN